MINLVNLDGLNRDHRSIKLISMINKSLHFKDCPVVTIDYQFSAGVDWNDFIISIFHTIKLSCAYNFLTFVYNKYRSNNTYTKTARILPVKQKQVQAVFSWIEWSTITFIEQIS